MSEQPTEAAVEADTGKPKDNGAAAHLERIRTIRRSVSRAQRSVDECTEELKELKGALGRVTCRLLAEIDDDQLPLFSEPKDSEAWREEAVVTLGLSEGVTAKLAEAGIATLGQLDTHCKTKQLATIKGCGAVMCETIETALEEYWAIRGLAGYADATDAENVETIQTPADATNV